MSILRILEHGWLKILWTPWHFSSHPKSWSHLCEFQKRTIIIFFNDMINSPSYVAVVQKTLWQLPDSIKHGFSGKWLPTLPTPCWITHSLRFIGKWFQKGYVHQELQSLACLITFCGVYNEYSYWNHRNTIEELQVNSIHSWHMKWDIKKKFKLWFIMYTYRPQWLTHWTVFVIN